MTRPLTRLARLSEVMHAFVETFSCGGRVIPLIDPQVWMDAQLRGNESCVQEQLIGEAWEEQDATREILECALRLLRAGFWKEPGRDVFSVSSRDGIDAIAALQKALSAP